MSLKTKVVSNWPFIAAIILLAIYGYNTLRSVDEATREAAARREAICPALLSISRSARDTLIVMKAEELCNSYVLDNLK